MDEVLVYEIIVQPIDTSHLTYRSFIEYSWSMTPNLFILKHIMVHLILVVNLVCLFP